MAVRRPQGKVYLTKYTNKAERAERNEEIYSRWLAHHAEVSMTDIGKEYGLTKQRIGQIIKRQGELALATEAEK
jgi:Mor family transcriptional regulator